MEFIEGLLCSRHTFVPSPKPPVASTLPIPTIEFTAHYHLEDSLVSPPPSLSLSGQGRAPGSVQCERGLGCACAARNFSPERPSSGGPCSAALSSGAPWLVCVDPG